MKKRFLFPAFFLILSLSVAHAQTSGADNADDSSEAPLFSLDMPDNGVSELEKTEVPESTPFTEAEPSVSATEEASPKPDSMQDASDGDFSASVVEEVAPESNSVPDTSFEDKSSESGAEKSSSERPSKKSSVEASKGGIAKVPAAKRPQKPDPEKVSAAAEKDENDKTADEHRNTIKYGLPSEISALVDTLIKNDDPRFSDELYDVFQSAKNNTIKERILAYFTKFKDPCLEDFAVNLLNDPYDESLGVVKACFQYISAVKTSAAVPAVISLIESENESYFNDAISALGEIGGPGEAVFLMEYLDRDDLTDAQRQTLMRTSGKMQAVETWDYLVDVLENEDENTFVRMYAAESLGMMGKKEAVPVLVEAFNATDPNLRQYVIKGLVNFPDDDEAKTTVIQGIRDEHWRVRQEAIRGAKEMGLTDAVPFLIYRVQNDSERVIKEESVKALASLGTKEADDFLVSQITDKKVGDSIKKKVVEVLLEGGKVGEKEILALADECLDDDRRKDLRYAIGKELAKYKRSQYQDVCLRYLASKDASTIGIGIDIYRTNKFSAAEDIMRGIYADKRANSGVRNRIKKMLEIEDD